MDADMKRRLEAFARENSRTRKRSQRKEVSPHLLAGRADDHTWDCEDDTEDDCYRVRVFIHRKSGRRVRLVKNKGTGVVTSTNIS
jgi:hypothetical protein